MVEGSNPELQPRVRTRLLRVKGKVLGAYWELKAELTELKAKCRGLLGAYWELKGKLTELKAKLTGS